MNVEVVFELHKWNNYSITVVLYDSFLMTKSKSASSQGKISMDLVQLFLILIASVFVLTFSAS